MDWIAFRQFVTYAGVGSVGTTAHYLLLLLLVERMNIAPYRGAVAGFVLGALINYSLNHRVTFNSAKRHQEALPKFLTVAATGVVLTGWLMAFATERLHIHYFLAQILTTALLVCLTFVGNRLWTFQETKE